MTPATDGAFSIPVRFILTCTCPLLKNPPCLPGVASSNSNFTCHPLNLGDPSSLTSHDSPSHPPPATDCPLTPALPCYGAGTAPPTLPAGLQPPDRSTPLGSFSRPAVALPEACPDWRWEQQFFECIVCSRSFPSRYLPFPLSCLLSSCPLESPFCWIYPWTLVI